MLSTQNLKYTLINSINDLKKRTREGRTNQVTPLGYFVLPQNTSTVVESLASPQDGWIYYATNLSHIRAYVNGSWQTVI